MSPSKRRPRFAWFAKRVSHAAGHPAAFLIAALVIVVWIVTGPIFQYSDTWQLAINTGTTIVTFLMVFLIQNTQNRDSQAMQVKLDELIRAIEGAHNALLNLEDLDDADLDRIRSNYAKLAEQAREGLRAGKFDTGVPIVEGEDPKPRHAKSALKEHR
ncbi:MAG: low affinity iron permease family protein [Planctomycetes bacterium]|nr:low affinity iron permease family protein [Planctomycetota bacterium]MBI3848103.1 low affinity iron permease family protein [Planctomycetota bacterium]